MFPLKEPKHAWIGVPKLHVIEHVKADLDRGSWLEYLPVYLPEGVGSAFAQECIRKMALNALTKASGVFTVGSLRIDLGTMHEEDLDTTALRALVLSQGFEGVYVVKVGNKWGAYLLPRVLCEDEWVSGFADRRTRSREQMWTERPGWQGTAQDIAELLEESREMAYGNRRRDLEELRTKASALTFGDLQVSYLAKVKEGRGAAPHLCLDEFWLLMQTPCSPD